MKPNTNGIRLLNNKCLAALSLVLSTLAPFGIPATANASEAPAPTYNATASTKISGLVRDTEGEPLVGATVKVKDRSIAVMTDADGRFSINVPSNCTLEISYIGFRNESVKVNPATADYTIVMTQDSQNLDDVVVVGYGEQKKVNLTGSVATINVGEIQESRPVTDISQAFGGQAAGVRMQMSSNQPGDDSATLRIRGTGTLNSSSPLIIIDGVESGISSVNPQDIESISVLKDAASASIYGSRAANGVVLITTKKGNSGKVKVNYNGFVSFQSLKQNVHPLTDYATYMELVNEGYANAGNGAYYIYQQDVIEDWRDNSLSGADPLMYPNNDWFKMTFKSAVATTHNISVSGGSDKLKAYASFGFTDNPGVLNNSGYKKYSTRINVDFKVNKWLSLGINASGYIGDREVAGGSLVNEIFDYAYKTSPGITFQLPDGRFGASPNSSEIQAVSSSNPLARLYRAEGGTRSLSVKPKFWAKITPFKGFSITGTYTMNSLNKQRREKPTAVDYWNPREDEVLWQFNPESQVEYTTNQSHRYFSDLMAQYTKNIKQLGLKAMVGTSYEKYKTYNYSAMRRDLLDPSLWDLKAATGESLASGSSSAWAMQSFFGRLNLDWDGKYLLEGNLRVDGSSRFHRDHRWGWFPSVSAGWRMDQEKFMTPLTDKCLSNLKIRASYGSLGNNSVGNYEYQTLYTGSGMQYVLNDAVAPGMVMSALSNPDLTWERTYVTDLGLDFGFFNNRFTGTFDWFNKRTANILINLPAPLVHGNRDVPTVNAAEVTNKGVELTLGWQDHIADFTYSVSANFTYIKNCVTKFKGKGEDGRSLNGTAMTWEGYPINAHYMLVCDRIIQTEEDMRMVQSMIDNAPVDPTTGTKLNPFATYGTPQMGDLFYVDTNGDGIVNEKDRMVVSDGNLPKYNIGLNIDLKWKGIDFGVVMDASLGAHTYFNSKYLSTIVSQGTAIEQRVADGRWYEGRETTATFPRLYPSTGNKINEKASTFYLQSLDFLKIRNIQLGYSLPKKWVKTCGFEKIRIYGSLENFLTFTKYQGFDPETGTAYPVMRQAAVGINVSF